MKTSWTAVTIVRCNHDWCIQSYLPSWIYEGLAIVATTLILTSVRTYCNHRKCLTGRHLAVEMFSGKVRQTDRSSARLKFDENVHMYIPVLYVRASKCSLVKKKYSDMIAEPVFFDLAFVLTHIVILLTLHL